jgi:ATP synthase protein I
MDKKRFLEGIRESGAIGQLASIGISIVVATFIGFGLGYFIDTYFGTRPVFMIIFLLLGVAAGFVGALRTINSTEKDVKK